MDQFNKDKNWCVYLLYNETKKRTYLGCSNSISKRLRQHNGEISGGARNTKLSEGSEKWELKGVITGKLNISTANSLESRIRKTKIYGLDKRLENMAKYIKVFDPNNTMGLEFHNV